MQYTMNCATTIITIMCAERDKIRTNEMHDCVHSALCVVILRHLFVTRKHTGCGEPERDTKKEAHCHPNPRHLYIPYCLTTPVLYGKFFLSFCSDDEGGAPRKNAARTPPTWRF